MKIIRFVCLACKSVFYLPTTPGEISCPNPLCGNCWAPRQAREGEQRGETFEMIPQRKVD